MNRSLLRVSVVELLGTFALVLFAAGVVCVNQLTVPAGQDAGRTPLFDHQPGLVGIALAQGLVLAAVLVLSMHVSGGYLNPAITVMLWVFGRLPNKRAAWLIVAQLLGAVLAGGVLRLTFDARLLSDARVGTPHLNKLVYHEPMDWHTLASGSVIEFILTFFLVFAIFGTIRTRAQWRYEEEQEPGAETPDDIQRSIDARLAGLIAGLTMTAGVLFAYPLTGAAANPARWFGPALWEWLLAQSLELTPGSAWADMFVYVAGPILAALVAGLVFFKLIPTEPSTHLEDRSRKRMAEAKRF